MRLGYYDMDGNAIEWDQMVELFKSDEARRVGYDKVGDVTVSTVLLVMDHSFLEDGPPVIFETMVFGYDAVAADSDDDGYSTKEQAAEGHASVLAAVKDGTLTREMVPA